MQTLKEFSPTPFDHSPADFPACEGLENWYVVPVSRTRDSEHLEQSNFETALKMLGGEKPTVKVFRFGHWGPGWFEIIIVKPGSKAEKTAREIEGKLEDYPVLDEEDFSRREFEEQIEEIESILPPEDEQTGIFPRDAVDQLWRHCWDNQGFDRGNYETLARDYMVSHGWIIPECQSVTYFPAGNTVCVRCHLVICRDYEPDEDIKAVLDHPEVHPAEHCQRCGRILADTFGDDLKDLPPKTDELISYGVN